MSDTKMPAALDKDEDLTDRGTEGGQPDSPVLGLIASNGHAPSQPTSRSARRRVERNLDERLLDYREVLSSERVPSSARDSARKWLLAAADVACVVAALAITGFDALLGRPLYQLVPVLGLWLLLNNLLGLYTWDSVPIDKSTIHELPKLAESVAIGVVAIFIIGPAVGTSVDRYTLLEFAMLAFIAMALSRPAVRMLVSRLYGPERALIVGSGPVADLIKRKLRAHPSYGTEVIGYVDDEQGDVLEDGSSLLGDLSCMYELCRDMHVDRLIVTFSRLEHEHLLDAIRAGNALGIKVTVVPRLFEVLGRSVVVDDVEGMSVLSLRGGSRSSAALAMKRIIDVIGAGFGLVFLAPVLGLIALAIKLDSKGPVIFSQVRIGRGNKPFRIRKFRTMIENAEHLRGQLADLNEVEFPLLKIPEDRDPRLTRVGRLLRRTMLDELPQLWNVLRGEMSLVGPRPLEPRDDAEVIGWHRARLELTPGLTGAWQAMGRHAIPFREMVTLDYLYVANWSLWQDIKLMLRTAQVILRSDRT